MTKDTSIKFSEKTKGQKRFLQGNCVIVILALVGSTKKKVGIYIKCFFENEFNLPLKL